MKQTRNNDVIIAISETPNEIRKFNPVTKSIESLSLNMTPTCISVSQDGNFAAVGHNGSFSYINLSTMELEDMYSVTTNAFDIVLAPNMWVYVFPKEDQWERIRCINLSTGTETLHTGNQIYAGTKAKLHPSGNYIYGADNDYEKYDITNGTAEYLYNAPDFNGGSEIWISDNGNRLFSKDRKVYNSSETEANDMTYNGELDGENKVVTLDYSTATGKIYAILATGNSWDETASNEVRKYDSQFLGYQGVVELPDFIIPDGNGGGDLYNSLGHFIFFNSIGTKYYVLVKIQEGSGAQNEWAIVSKDV